MAMAGGLCRLRRRIAEVLRQAVPVTGVQPGEYARRSLGIGGATHLLQRLVEWGQWSTVDRVGVRFRGSKGDYLRKGAMLTLQITFFFRKFGDKIVPGFIGVYK